MSFALLRIALLQMCAVVYSILVVGLIVKSRFSSPAPPFLGSYIRDYGVWLLFVPTIWCIWGVCYMNRSRAKDDDADLAASVGFILLIGLLVLAVMGTVSALTYRSTLLKAPVQTSPQTAPQHTP